MTFIVAADAGAAFGPEEWEQLAASIRREIKEQVEAQCRAYRIGFRDALKVGDEPEPVQSMSGVDLTRGIWGGGSE